MSSKTHQEPVHIANRTDFNQVKVGRKANYIHTNRSISRTEPTSLNYITNRSMSPTGATLINPELGEREITSVTLTLETINNFLNFN